MMEIYGEHEEYIALLKGELLDEIDGTHLYECQIKLNKLQSEITFKVYLDVSYILITPKYILWFCIPVLQIGGQKKFVDLWTLGSNSDC